MKQHSTKILAGILFLLVVAFVLTKVFRSPARESNLDGRALKVDTARVSEIRLNSSATEGMEIRLVRHSEGWTVAQEDLIVDAEPYAVNGVLRTLAGMEYERIVTRNEEKWNDYGVGDTTGLSVEVYDAGNKLASMLIGEEKSGNTYLRQANGDEVFAVDGMIRGSFDKGFNDFRNKAFVRVEKDHITRLTFTYPADSSFVIHKQDSVWILQDVEADSASVENYLNSLRTKNLATFADDFSPARDPDMSILVESDSDSLENIKAWFQPDSTWRLTSALREGVYFSNKGSTIIKDLFKSRKHFE